MEQATMAAKSAGTGTLIISITISILAQRALKHIWIFYASLQIIILFTLKSSNIPPASTNIFFGQLLDIIYLQDLMDFVSDRTQENE